MKASKSFYFLPITILICSSKVIKMKKALAVIAMFGVVVVTESISCYTACTDQSMMIEGNENVTSSCDNTHKNACPDSFDICTAISTNMTLPVADMIVTSHSVTRGCGLSSVPETHDTETVCGIIEKSLESVEMSHFACRVDSCSSDYCNTHDGKGRFADPDDDPYNFVSSGSGLKVTFLVTAITAVAVFHV